MADENKTVVTKKAAAKKTVAKKVAASKKVTTKKAAAVATTAKKVVTKKAVTRPETATASEETAATKKATTTTAKKVVAKKSVPSKKAATAAAPANPPVEKAAPTRETMETTPVDLGASPVTPEERYRMVEEAAYYKAEKHNFDPAFDAQNWAESEREIDELLQQRSTGK